VVVLQQENKLIEEKITRLQSDRDEQGLEIRKQRKLVRPGEKTFIIQDARPAVHP
jgi:cell division protein FtsB